MNGKEEGKESMSGDECGDFVALALVLVVVAVGVGLCIAVPWFGALLLLAGIGWLVWGWIRDEREHRARPGSD